MLFYHLRDRGIHVQDGFPLFLTTAHTEADVAQIAAAFADSLDEMARAGIVGGGETAVAAPVPAAESGERSAADRKSDRDLAVCADGGRGILRVQRVGYAAAERSA